MREVSSERFPTGPTFANDAMHRECLRRFCADTVEKLQQAAFPSGSLK